jgi:hypothetical protein
MNGVLRPAGTKKGGMMASQNRRLFADFHGRHDADEALAADLVEQLEIYEADFARLRKEADHLRLRAEMLQAEREEIQFELALAQAWVRELAVELEEADSLLAAKLGSD